MAKKTDRQIAENLMKTLGVTYEEALEIIAFDKDEIENEEVNQIEEKVKATAKDEKPKSDKPKRSSLEKVKHQKAKKKVDENKEKIFHTIGEMMTSNAELFINPQDLTSSKITFMDKDGNFYSISLTKHKAKPDGYSLKENE
jgi:hypothetical protein